MINEARHIFLLSVLFVRTMLRLYTFIDQLCTSLVHAAKYNQVVLFAPKICVEMLFSKMVVASIEKIWRAVNEN